MNSFGLVIFTMFFVGTLANFEEARAAFNNLNDSQRQELQKIFEDGSLTKGQVKEKVKSWVDNQDQSVKDMHSKMMAKMDEMKNNLQQKTAGLSDEAKPIAAKMAEIHQNDALTLQQTCQQVNDAFSQASDSVRQELHYQPKDCNNIAQGMFLKLSGNNQGAAH
ncbi:hypothetical protein M3Y94_00256700 [Aphelenchoides besseyi]|nr:hypothetical protein M3Y94_00256700 [Aphelenchoides besseyi]KAI6236215.1 hypothetical protein M3Y95_00133900 [Aphelenchoides besseyi]